MSLEGGTDTETESQNVNLGKKVSRRFCDRTLDLSYYDLRTLPLSYISIVFLYNYSDCAKVRHPSCNNSRDENFDIKFRESQLITDL